MPTQIIHTTVKVPFKKAYAFACKPENFPKWAAGMSSSPHKTYIGWAAETPAGEATVRFSAPNDFGVLNHWVKPKGKPEMDMPHRHDVDGSKFRCHGRAYHRPVAPVFWMAIDSGNDALCHRYGGNVFM
ncbi:MAG: hypothetical protein KGI75_12140 [Rhizobiaceae bacterium]|nr:hypothetical protein [Rhizobiaceae bacterium]